MGDAGATGLNYFWRVFRSQDGSSYVLRPVAETETLALPTTDIKGFALGNAQGSMDGYNATHSQIAAKTSNALLETSQSDSVVTREQMDDQGSQTVSQAMRYTPCVLTNPYGATHRYDYVELTSKRTLYEAYRQVQATVGTQSQRGMGFDFSGPVAVRHTVRSQQ